MKAKYAKDKPVETCKLVYQQTPEGKEVPGITCLWCKRTSWNPNDVKFLYCGHCHHFFKKET